MSEVEYKTSLARAFELGRADFIILDGWSSDFNRKSTQWAMASGYLNFCDRASEQQSDEQYTALCYRPTQKLRDEIGDWPTEYAKKVEVDA